jgi:hypothetical protein
MHSSSLVQVGKKEVVKVFEKATSLNRVKVLGVRWSESTPLLSEISEVPRSSNGVVVIPPPMVYSKALLQAVKWAKQCSARRVAVLLPRIANNKPSPIITRARLISWAFAGKGILKRRMIDDFL